jgi:hypothetical protein
VGWGDVPYWQSTGRALAWHACVAKNKTKQNNKQQPGHSVVAKGKGVKK